MKLTAPTLLAVVTAIACNRPSDLPDMGVSRTALSFEAPGGSGEPSPQTIWVQNTGRGSLVRPTATIAYQDGTGWLTATVSGDAAPYEVTVQPATAGLAPGVYGATMTLACENASSSPLQVSVTLTVPDPRFTLSVSSLAFEAPRGGGDPAAQTFQVLNAGRGTLPVPEIGISYVGPTGWLAAEVSGTPDAYAVKVTAHVAGMYSGVFTATMTVGAAGAEGPPRTLAVTLTIPPAEIALPSPEIRIDGPADGTDPLPVSVAVANAGGGLLAAPTASIAYAPDWTGPAWLDATVSGDAAPYTLTLQARQSRETTALERGTYVATVTVTSPNAGNSPQTIAVTLVVPPPSLLLGGISDYFDGFVYFTGFAGCPPPPQRSSFFVWNGGPGTLAPPVAEVPPEMSAWLDASVSGDREPYVVTVAMKGLPGPTDVRAGDVVLVSPGAASPATVHVSYFENASSETPVVHVTPASLSFWAQDGAGDPGAKPIGVATEGGCIPPPAVSVSYPAGATPWIATQIVSGFLRHDVIVTASTAGMSPGESRTASLVITPEGAAAVTVRVTLRLGALVPTTPMTVPRTEHTITALPNGRAVAIGGRNLRGNTPTAEIYDPAGGWTTGGSMAKPRWGHGAALLEDGDVLVCGGYAGTNALDEVLDATCEVNTGWLWWNASTTLRLPRYRPTLVPLDRFKVLVASQDGPPEIMDFVSQTSRLVEGVSAWSAVKLADGRVLTTADRSAWIYDPVRDAWTPTGSPLRVRAYPALIPLPSGRVLAVGWDPYWWSGISAEIWDPRAGTWALTAAPSAANDSTNTIALSNGRVVSVAGYVYDTNGYLTYSDDVEMFDPATETWSAVATLPTARGGVVPVQLTTGMVFMAGGRGGPASAIILDEAFTW